ncbi:hypothetical protein D3C85_1069590 [compost metagenome]
MRHRELTSCCGPFFSRQSSSIWIMVGASRISLTFSWSIASSTPCGVKDCTIACVPPLINNAVIAAKSARWNIGIACRKTASAVKRPWAREFNAEKATLLWLSMTPLG